MLALGSGKLPNDMRLRMAPFILDESQLMQIKEALTSGYCPKGLELDFNCKDMRSVMSEDIRNYLIKNLVEALQATASKMYGFNG